MKIYLDTSVLNRIFDNQSQVRIYLEATAVLLIFMLIDKGYLELVSSEVLIYENENNPYEERKLFVNSLIRKAKLFQELDEEILERAKEMETLGIKGLDALHIACAERLKVDYFLTCDDKIIKKYKGVILVKNPVEFLLNILKEED
ncbi:TPA: type II toxin-antitoxin system VapC family toxin [bacterium]|nr:type II toxin-antitoxin system VapC family toxin [bacterium]